MNAIMLFGWELIQIVEAIGFALFVNMLWKWHRVHAFKNVINMLFLINSLGLRRMHTNRRILRPFQPIQLLSWILVINLMQGLSWYLKRSKSGSAAFESSFEAFCIFVIVHGARWSSGQFQGGISLDVWWPLPLKMKHLSLLHGT